jgi:hypothetical protein
MDLEKSHRDKDVGKMLVYTRKDNNIVKEFIKYDILVAEALTNY